MQTPSDFQSWFYRGLEAATSADPRAATDALVACSPGAEERECLAGCDYCCHFPVGVTSTEASYLASWLRTELPASELSVLQEQIELRAVDVENQSWQDQAASKRGCVLLGDGGLCRAYTARPVACRGWNSLSLQVCEDESRGLRDAKPASDGPAYVACLGAHEGLRQSGDGETYELTSALGRALQGGGAFAGCKRPSES